MLRSTAPINISVSAQSADGTELVTIFLLRKSRALDSPSLLKASQLHEWGLMEVRGRVCVESWVT